MKTTRMMLITLAVGCWIGSTAVYAQPNRADDRPERPAAQQRGDRPSPERPQNQPDWRDRRPADREAQGPGDRPPPDRPQADRPRRLTEEQQQQALAVLRDVNHDFAAQLTTAIERGNPERATNALNRVAGPLLDMHELKQNDPELYRLRAGDQRARVETLKLTRQIHTAQRSNNAAEVEELTARLREHLVAHFEIRQKMRERELAELEERIEKMRADLAEHREKEEQLIDQAVERITRPRPARRDRDRADDEEPDLPDQD